MSRSTGTAEQPALSAWPSPDQDEKEGERHPGRRGAKGRGGGPSPSRRRRRRDRRRQRVTTTPTTGISLREYSQYKELFYNLTLRELRSKYKRSVIGWGWSMINPLANMAVYTIVFATILQIHPPEGSPSGLHNYALMLLAAMLPFNFFQGSVMESMGSLLGNQNLIQKTYFPRELIPASTVASKIVSHFIEMGLLLVSVMAFGNWRAVFYIPEVLLFMAIVGTFGLGLALLFSIGNVFYRDIQHFSGILFFIWMFLTPVAYPYYIVGGGLNGSTATFSTAKYIHLFGHALSLGTIFKANPMTDAVLAFQSFLYNGSQPSSSHVQGFSVPVAVPAETVKIGGHLHTFPAHTVTQHLFAVITSNVSWGDCVYLLIWALGALAVGLAVFRKYEARLPEEL
ncbi:MAG TPA: ABC transporter permease [Acidimicrobiales bacterium]|nr:ABC transporter permease [Acidimicrobiales bacterium]